MTAGDPGVVVIGAGVTGLTTAVVLAEAGLSVKVLAKDPPAQTTSAAAGAMWGPYLVEPRDRVQAWASDSLECFTGLAGVPGTGVRLVSGTEASRTNSAPPGFLRMLDGVRVCAQSELPDGFVAGWRYTVPLVDMDIYLPYLCDRLEAAGGSLQLRTVAGFDEAARLAPIVINATGTGARHLARDSAVTAVRGQLVILDNPGITEFFTEDTGWSPDLLHIYPHGDRLVLGGLAQEGNWNLEPDEDTAQAIIERCATIEPRLVSLPVRAHRVGLRPTRPTIRCDADSSVTRYRLLHNYGHGGAGVSLSWGCASEIKTMITGS
ncbi:MAG TPA: FAD-dependent oxidoreductase [Streptosporangiaceae bacterium]|nr:FAD-dependent oxidoreductase [Streptosporangiaceae bacterium]